MKKEFNWMKKIKKIWILAFLAVALLLPHRTAEAAGGGIYLQLPESAQGVEITLYCLADYDSATGRFIYNSYFVDCGIVLAELSDAAAVENAAEQLAALAKSGNVPGIVGTVDAQGKAAFTDLALGYYLAVQTSGTKIQIQKAMIPLPYTDEYGNLIYEAVVEPKYEIPSGAVILNKVNEENAALANVVFRLDKKTYVSENGQLPEGAETGQDGEGRFYWKTVQSDLKSNEKGQISLSGLTFGVYRFVEESAPGGVILSKAPVYFSVDEAGTVRQVRGIYRAQSGTVPEVNVVNQRTSVSINKVDTEGKAVAGAHLVIKDLDGNKVISEIDGKVFDFVTTSEAYELKGLPEGDYFLSEVEAPEGYKVALDVPFSLTADTSGTISVTMTDERIPEPEEEDVKYSILVTKALEDQFGQSLMADDAVFYVALFADEARTQRVSNVVPLHYYGTIRETVVFENLEPDTKYYVGETDEFGKLIDTIVEEDGIYAPVYSGQYEITPTRAESEKEYAFSNMFYKLPSGYYYGGNLTITKKVMMGTDEYATDEVFYARVFKDKALKDPYSEVLAISMDGGSQSSVTIPVYIGDNQDARVTYYVAETDKDGNILDPGQVNEFEITIDQQEIVLSPQDSEKTVVITNTYPEEESESEFESEEESEPETPETPETSETPRTPGTPNVRTGDDTPIGLFIALLVAAGAVLGGLFCFKKRKNSR